MSEPWPEDEDEGIGPAAPLPPDDRLWRHPSELSWERARARTSPLATRAGDPTGGSSNPGRLLLVTVTSGVVGAALALGVLAANGALEPGGPERIVERVGVRDLLADPLAPEPELGLPDLVAATAPSIVGVEGEQAGAERTGSGVLLLDDGHVVTAAELVDGAETVRIVLPDGTAVVAEVVAIDEITDVAVLEAALPAGGDWEPAVRGDADAVRVGDATVAVGGPERPGGDPTIALGVVRSLDQMARSSGGWTVTGLIATDMDLLPAALGGALVDRAGRVIGIITDVGDGTSRVGLSMPIDRAMAALEAAIDGDERVVWLGIQGYDHDLPTTSLAAIVASRAVQVHAVAPGSPAEEAGIRPGDLLVSVEGEAVDSMGDLVVALRRHEPGDQVDVGVLRDGTHLDLEVTLGATEG